MYLRAITISSRNFRMKLHQEVTTTAPLFSASSPLMNVYLIAQAYVINDCFVHSINDDLPFGGVGTSGMVHRPLTPLTCDSFARSCGFTRGNRAATTESTRLRPSLTTNLVWTQPRSSTLTHDTRPTHPLRYSCCLFSCCVRLVEHADQHHVLFDDLHAVHDQKNQKSGYVLAVYQLLRFYQKSCTVRTRAIIHVLTE